MKLLFLYIFDYEGIQKQGLNFHSDWRFEYEPREKKLSWTYKPVLPKEFYWGNHGKKSSNVECISAIVDESGVGKKAVARFFSELQLGNRGPKHILVYEKDNTLIIRYCLETMTEHMYCSFTASKLQNRCFILLQESNKPFNISVYSSDTNEQVKTITKQEYRGEKPFDFIYLSPYFSLERMILPVGFGEDLSSTGLTVEYAKDIETLDLKAYKCQEMKYLLHFLKNQETQVPFEGQSSPRELLVRPNEYVFRQISAMALVNDAQEDERADSPESEKRIMDFPEQFLELRKIIDIDPGFYGRQSLFGKFFLCFFAACCYDSAFLSASLPRPFARLEKLNDNWNIKYEDVSGFAEAFGAGEFFANLSECTEIPDIELKMHLADSQQAIDKLLNSYYACFPKTDFVCWSFDKPLSPGMLSVATMCARLSAWVPKDDEKPCVVFLDDVEMTLYPRDQRKLVKGFLEFFQENFKNRRFHLIFASASPVLLSDIPIGNVSIFEEETDDYGKAVKPDGMPPKLKVREVKDVFQPNTFGASIFDLYSDFFSSSEGTFGEFATEKLDGLLQDAEKIVNEESEYIRLELYM